MITLDWSGRAEIKGDLLNKYVFDTSSLFKLFFLRSEVKVDILRNSLISELTFFEIGNVLRKRKDEALAKSSELNLLEISKEMEVVVGSISKGTLFSQELPNILKISLESGLTFYDASFLYLTQRENRILVTEDQKLAKIAKKYNVESSSVNEVT